MNDKPPLKIYSLAALHVAVYEGWKCWLSQHIKIWSNNYKRDECRRLWCRLKTKANDDDRKYMKHMIKEKYGKNSVIYNTILEFDRLWKEKIKIEINGHGVFHKSIHWESEDDEGGAEN